MPGRNANSQDYPAGFNGKRNDPETVGTGDGTQDYGMRIYNPSLGRFLSVDPLTAKYPFYSPYQFAGDMPTRYIDLDGGEPKENGTEDGQMVTATNLKDNKSYTWMWGGGKWTTVHDEHYGADVQEVSAPTTPIENWDGRDPNNPGGTYTVDGVTVTENASEGQLSRYSYFDPTTNDWVEFYPRTTHDAEMQRIATIQKGWDKVELGTAIVLGTALTIYGGTVGYVGPNVNSGPPDPEISSDKGMSYPGNDPKSPPKGFEWRGQPGSTPGSSNGNYYNPGTGESLHPDLEHPEPIGPHWDYRDPAGQWWRIMPDGTNVPK